MKPEKSCQECSTGATRKYLPTCFNEKANAKSKEKGSNANQAHAFEHFLLKVWITFIKECVHFNYDKKILLLSRNPHTKPNSL